MTNIKRKQAKIKIKPNLIHCPGLATVFIRDGGAPISAVFCKEHWR